jgi:hypothetical protein
MEPHDSRMGWVGEEDSASRLDDKSKEFLSAVRARTGSNYRRT